LLYKINSEIKTIQLVLEQDFRKPVLDQVRQNIQLIIEQLNGHSDVRSVLDLAIKQRTPKTISQYLEKANEILFSDINESTLSFVSKNKNLLLV
jgi:DNA-binding protein Fis